MEAKRTPVDSKHVEHTKDADDSISPVTGRPTPRKSLVQLLNPYSGVYTSRPFWLLVMDPFIVLANPAVIWAVLLMAFPTLWVVSINLLVAQIFTAPPYSLGTAELGYMSAGPAVGGLLGSIVSGALSDPIIGWASRRNKGIYEPEFRLILIILALITSAIAYFPFGHLAETGTGPVAMSVLWGIAVASVQVIMTAVGAYIVDSYNDTSVEIFIATMVFKNFLFFGFTCKSPDALLVTPRS